MAQIIVVEDEISLRADMVEYLTGCGHQVTGCDSAAAMDQVLLVQPADIFILDVNLPGENGFSIAKRLRESGDVGIIMLTARGLNMDRVVGLEIGADVYLVKPVEFRELEAQIRALLRRIPIAGSIHKNAVAAIVPDGGAVRPVVGVPGRWSYDQITWSLVAPNGRAVKLTGNERVFVSLLVSRPGEPVSRAEIFAALGKRSWDAADRSVDSMVRRLRAKGVEQVGSELPIESVHGTGYAFAAPVCVQ